MSAINSIATSQPSVPVMNAKPTAQQTLGTSQPQQSVSSSVAISSAALYANYEQIIAEKTAGQKQVIAYSLANPTTPLVTENAYVMAHDESMNGASVGGGVSLAGKTPNDAISYSNGEPVTLASQAYYTKQNASYQNQVLELYNTEKAKGTTPGQIISDIFDLQARQPDAFRAMNQWPPASGPSSIQDATSTPGTTPQYLNAGGQVVNAPSSYSNYDKLIAQEVAQKREQVLSNAFDSLISSLAHQSATTADSATISQAARDLAAKENKITPYSDDPRAAASYMQQMAEKFAGTNKTRATYAKDPSNPLYAQLLDQAAQQHFSVGTGEGAGIDLSWGKTSANLSKMDDNLHYIGGEPVTAASQAYQQQQVNSYKNAATQLYNEEKAKGTPAGDIWIKIMDLQEQQPARFRAMMGWPTAADFSNTK